MSLVEVACPGCQTPLKAPPGMAGRKARCKKCNTPFRIPGETVDGVGESQQLSVARPPAAQPAEDDIPSAMPVEDDEPLAAVAEEEPLAAVVADEPAPPPADPFAFSSAPPEPKKKDRKPRDADAEAPPAPAPAASDNPFAFTSAPPEPSAKKSAPPEPPAKKKERKPRDEAGEAPPAPAPAAAGDPFAFTDVPPGPKKADRKPRGKDDTPAPADRPAAASDDPFTFTSAPPEPSAKKKEKDRKPRDEAGEAPPVPAPVASGDPFAFTSAPPEPKKKDRTPGDEPAPAAAGEAAKKTEKDRKPRDADAEAPPAPAPAASDNPFAFTSAPPEPSAKKSAPPEPPAKKKERKPRDEAGEAPPAPAPAAADPFAFGSAPAEPKKADRKPRDEDEDEGEDDAAPAAPATSGDPFTFGSAPAPALAEKADRRPRDDKADRKKPAARKAPAGGGGNGLVKVIVGATVFAVVTGGIVVGALVVLNSKPGEVAKNEKKVDPPSNEPAVVPAAAPEPAGKADAVPKEQAKTTPRPQKGGAKGKGGALALPPGKVLTFPPKPAAPKLVTEPASTPVPVAVPFADARRFFPPGKADGDIGVLWRSAVGFQGVGEKVTLTLFSPNSGKETAKVEVDHDGTPDPAADLSVDGGTFAVGHRTTGKVTVWDVRKKAKKLDAFDPYADKPEHKAAKLAAVYLTEPPDRVVTVTTAGAVHVWDVATKGLAGEYVPAKAAPNKVAGGRGVAPLPTRRGVVVAVGGTVYKVDTAGAVTGTEAEDLGGDVGRSLALAVSPGGKVLYAFETDVDGKREKAVMQLAGGNRSPAFRWPADAGEPVAAAWAGDNVASLATSQGAAVWFDADGGFNPIAVARTPDDKAVHVVAGTDNHWSLLPSPGDAKASVVVELALPPQGVGDPLTPAARRPMASLVLDLKGLSQEAPAAKQ